MKNNIVEIQFTVCNFANVKKMWMLVIKRQEEPGPPNEKELQVRQYI